MHEVIRYDAVHLRYEDSNIRPAARQKEHAARSSSTTAQQGEAAEVAQVVSYLSACADGYDPDAPHPGSPEPLMTVAQHQRILAGVRQQRDKLAGLLREAAQIIDRLTGDPVAAGEMLGDIDAALAETNRA